MTSDNITIFVTQELHHEGELSELIEISTELNLQGVDTGLEIDKMTDAPK